jgi:hypothetical protein
MNEQWGTILNSDRWDTAMRGRLLIETLLVLLVGNAIVWFAVAMGWP